MDAPEITRIWHDLHYRHTTPESHPKLWRPFLEIDPLNPGNRVAGHIQIVGGDEYGALSITEVNGRPAPQFLKVTPKAAYPFHKGGEWVLYGAQEVESYLKIDGTNICQYAYQDADGRPFTTFKLRTRPFMSPHFLNLLERALEQYPAVQQRQLQPNEGLAYELYGYENRMLIRYDQPIDLALLFGRDAAGNLLSPQPEHPLFAGLDCPVAEHRTIALSGDLTDAYRQRQQEISARLVRLEDEYFAGEEGEMLYVRFAAGARTESGDFTRLIKLKPPEIEEIHWASDYVPREELAAVARNVFEVSDDPEVADMVQLLAEDWTDDQIGRSLDTIERVLTAAKERRAFQEEVLAVYAQLHAPEAFRTDRPAVMRAMSQRFPKAMMSRVYAVLVERGYG